MATTQPSCCRWFARGRLFLLALLVQLPVVQSRPATQIEHRLLAEAITGQRSGGTPVCTNVSAAVIPLHVDEKEYHLCVGHGTGKFTRRTEDEAEGDSTWVAEFDAETVEGVRWLRAPFDGNIRAVVSGVYRTADGSVAVLGLHYCDSLESTTTVAHVGAYKEAQGILASLGLCTPDSTPSFFSSTSSADDDKKPPCHGENFVGPVQAWIAAPLLCNHKELARPDVARLNEVFGRVHTTSNFSGRVYDTAQGRQSTYGELAPAGFMHLLEELPKGHEIGYTGIFVDVGSGLGKLPVAAALVTPVKAAVGIEVVASRASAASDAREEAIRQGLLAPSEANRIQLQEGDAFSPGALPENATHVFCNSLCFDDALNLKLITAMIGLEENSLHCFVAPVKYDIEEMAKTAGLDSVPCLRHKKSVKVEMSWSPAVEVHYYCCDRKFQRTSGLTKRKLPMVGANSAQKRVLEERPQSSISREVAEAAAKERWVRRHKAAEEVALRRAEEARRTADTASKVAAAVEVELKETERYAEMEEDRPNRPLDGPSYTSSEQPNQDSKWAQDAAVARAAAIERAAVAARTAEVDKLVSSRSEEDTLAAQRVAEEIAAAEREVAERLLSLSPEELEKLAATRLAAERPAGDTGGAPAESPAASASWEAKLAAMSPEERAAAEKIADQQTAAEQARLAALSVDSGDSPAAQTGTAPAAQPPATPEQPSDPGDRSLPEQPNSIPVAPQPAATEAVPQADGRPQAPPPPPKPPAAPAAGEGAASVQAESSMPPSPPLPPAAKAESRPRAPPPPPKPPVVPATATNAASESGISSPMPPAPPIPPPIAAVPLRQPHEAQDFIKTWTVSIEKEPVCPAISAAELMADSDAYRTTVAKRLGAVLHADRAPLIECCPGAAVAAWNKKDDEKAVRVGDVVLQISDACAADASAAMQMSVLLVARYPPRFTVHLQRQGRALGVKYRKGPDAMQDIVSGDTELVITDLLKDGALGVHNAQHAAAGNWDQVVLKGFIITAVNGVSGDILEMTRQLREMDDVVLKLRRPEPVLPAGVAS
eukprot:TRINITY_DN121688_c0_g1_i1.p1 TRINITY_DN121688_c0_g1~~TRINITY_DN121688_c0_g1_i1.p1  ORF type:complete len:1054 (+),score=242.67 TRINITY_DN121688_c0_g1_i1:219-3380(+)